MQLDQQSAHETAGDPQQNIKTPWHAGSQVLHLPPAARQALGALGPSEQKVCSQPDPYGGSCGCVAQHTPIPTPKELPSKQLMSTITQTAPATQAHMPS